MRELSWWIANLPTLRGKSLTSCDPDMLVSTDASDLGWGAMTQTDELKGHWDAREILTHINVKELMAVELTVRAIARDLRGTHIHVQCDNMSTVAYINRMGGPALFRCWK